MAAFFFGTGLLGFGVCPFHQKPFPPLSLLWVHWRHWSWHRLHHTRINLGEIFSPPPRFCNRSCHHGLWFCRSHCSSPHAATHPHGGPYPHLLPHGRCLLGHHGPLCPLPQTARPEKEHDADSQSLTGKTASEAMHTWQFQSLWWVFSSILPAASCCLPS